MELFESAKLFIKYLSVGGDVEEVVKALSVSQKALDAYISYYDTYNYPELSDQIAKLKKAQVSLGQVHSSLGKLKDTSDDLEALGGILAAAKVLNAKNGKKVGSEERAKAFGLLFKSAGTFMAKLPPPANTYAPILFECTKLFKFAHRAFTFGEGGIREGTDVLQQSMRNGEL